MRIISQDGNRDFNYESCELTVVKDVTGTFIFVNTMIEFAKYSTEAKARKAMEMLRKAYAGLPIIMQNIEITDDVAEMFKEWNKQGIMVRTEDNQPSKVEFLNNGYFQFPADDEVEEQDV